MVDLKVFDLFDLKAEPVLFRKGSRLIDGSGLLQAHGDALDDPDDGSVLEVHTRATYSGTPINGRLYPFSKVREGAKTFLKDYAKPVLLHHKSGGGLFGPDPCDPIGRVKGYQFQPLVAPNKADALLDDRVTKTGTGVLNLKSHITDADAIRKIIDGRYLTTSVGFNTDSLTCTVCGSDWKQDEICEHRPGRVYAKEGKSRKDARARQILALLVTGDIAYHEWSFVNVPAAKRCSVTSHNLINDALDDAGCLGLRTTELCLDHLTVGGEDYDVILAKDREVIEVSGSEDKLSEDVEEAEWVYAPDVDSLGAIERDAEPKGEEPKLTDDEFSYAHILKSLRDQGILDYEALEEEDGLTKNDVDLLIADLENDAKLTTKQRKRLKGSTFCGPNRSFPVPDCAHVRAGFRLLNRAKVSSSTRSSIRSCLNRKNASMGCGVKSRDMADTTADDATGPTTPPTEDGTQAEPEVTTTATGATTIDMTVTSTDTDPSGPTFEEVQAENEALKAQVDTLTAENQELAGKVKTALAQRLFDLRLSHGHPSIVDLAEDKFQEMVDGLAERSTGSLEDAIQDEQAWGKSRPAPIERGAVTSPALADRSKDVTPIGHEAKPRAGVFNASEYAANVAGMFPRGDK